MVRPVIHFELIFVYGIREGFNFILLHVDTQHHVLKRLFFSHWMMVFTSLLKIIGPYMWGFICGLYILFFALYVCFQAGTTQFLLL